MISYLPLFCHYIAVDFALPLSILRGDCPDIAYLFVNLSLHSIDFLQFMRSSLVFHIIFLEYLFTVISMYLYVLNCCRSYLLSWLSTVAPAVLLDLPLCYALQLTLSDS